jgi:hypothetical protein
MTDIANLAFGIDTSSIASGIQGLLGLRDAATQAAQAHDALIDRSIRFQVESDKTTVRASAMRQQFVAVSESLDQMVAAFDRARSRAASSQVDFQGFSRVADLTRVVGDQFAQTTGSLENYYKSAQQMGLTTQQTVISLQRVTDALQAQTAAGLALRQMMTNIGTDLRGLTSSDAAVALQRFTTQLQALPDGQNRLRTAQQVLGIGNDPISYLNITQPAYVPVAERERRSLENTFSPVAGALGEMASSQARTNANNDAMLQDLRAQFITPAMNDATRIQGIVGGAGLTTNEGERLILKFMRDNPYDPASQANTRMGHAPDSSGIDILLGNPSRAKNMFSQYYGTMAPALAAVSNQQYEDEAANNESPFGPQSTWFRSTMPWLRSVGRSAAIYLNPNSQTVADMVGPAMDHLDQQKELERTDPANVLKNRRAAASVLADNFGLKAPGMQLSAEAQTRLLGDSAITTNFADAYGVNEGRVIQRQQMDANNRLAADAMNPARDMVDEQTVRSFMLAGGMTGRGQNSAMISYLQGLKLDAAGMVKGQSDVGGVFRQLSPAQQQGFDQVQGNEATLAMGDSAQQLSRTTNLFQEMTNALSGGSAAVEDAKTRFEAYQEALNRDRLDRGCERDRQ